MTALEIPAPFKVSKIRPQLLAKGKTSDSLFRTDTLGVGVQVVAPAEGETNLHAHPGTDSTWVVLDGQATFYGTEDDVELAVLDKNEMILIPEASPTGSSAAATIHWSSCTSPRAPKTSCRACRARITSRPRSGTRIGATRMRFRERSSAISSSSGT